MSQWAMQGYPHHGSLSTYYQVPNHEEKNQFSTPQPMQTDGMEMLTVQFDTMQKQYRTIIIILIIIVILVVIGIAFFAGKGSGGQQYVPMQYMYPMSNIQ